MKKEIDSKIAIAVIIVVAFLVGSYLILECKSFPGSLFSCVIEKTKIPVVKIPSKKSSFKTEGIKSFSSEDEFKSYLQKAELSSFQYLGWRAIPFAAEEKGMPIPLEVGMEEAASGEAPERVSETNVQVVGIDEPDIVKTDGKEIYFSSGRGYYPRWGWGVEMVIPEWVKGTIKTIKAFPPTDLELESEIDKTGNLLLLEDMLVIFSGDKIYGYDVSNPKVPTQKWTIELEKNNYIVAARLYNKKIYLVTKNTINRSRPCPIKPVSIEGNELELKCIDIYHPVYPVPIDTTYVVLSIDYQSGKVDSRIAFVGSSNSSVVYMSKNALYISYLRYKDFGEIISDFFNTKCRDLVPNWLISKLNKLSKYDISSAAKMTEFEVLWEQYYGSLDEDERLRLGNEFENRFSDYYKEHKREVEKTGIVKIGLDKFNILASGNVPGELLNQFSLDEYKDYLRTAVTVGNGLGGFWSGGNRESANDVYILDKDLQIVGSVKDLGLKERIYSVRFIEDKGYVVTFRRTDPFYVLDLSNPKKPDLKGELKIPGYSSYLHPITKDKILGIGREGSKVKISLFDVAVPEDPSEKDKYILDEYWSDILNTHHAFLLDKKHNIFFLPGSRGGYVFSYKDDQLSLKKAISNIRARRAVYINDYLYIIGDNKIVVLSEIDWQRVNELEL